MTVTKVNYANPAAEVSVGTESFCIYLLGAGGAALDLECDTTYPAALDTDASHYLKR